MTPSTYAQEPTSSSERTCPRCGRPVQRGPRAKWCSDNCRIRVWQEEKDATLGPVNIAPPAVILGWGNRAVIETAVRHAQGWNLFTHGPGIYASRSPVLADVEASEGRGRRLARSVYFNIGRMPRDISLRTLLEELEAAGAEEAMLVLLDAGDAPVRALAARVL